MPIDASIISQAQNIPQIRYQPESQFESFAKIQPTLNAMQQMKQRAVAARGAAEIEDFIRKSGHNINLGQLGTLLVRVGKVEEGTKLLIADSNRRKLEAELGSMEFGNQAAAPTGTNAMAGGLVANAMAQSAAVQPSVPNPAVTAPAMPATAPSMAPQGQPTGFRPTPQQLARMAAIDEVGARVAGVLAPFAKPEPTPSEITIAQKFGFELTPEGYSAMKGAGRAEPSGAELLQLQRQRDSLPANDPRLPEINARIKRLNAPPAPLATLQLPAQEKAFEGTLGSEQAKKLIADRAVAEDAVSIIETVNTGRQLLKSGMITGFGAEFLTNFGAFLNQAGVNFAEDQVANTQAFSANMAANVGRIIKQFGAGTGLSDADREYAEKMAGGKITLDRKAIERILDINERAARNVIKYHNRRAQGVKSNIPLTVEMPPEQQQSEAPTYARNPKTGERIMSVDGGNTWTPAR